MSNTGIAVRNIRRHKSRSFLTILGIAVGIGLVLSLGAITEGLSAQMEEQFEDMAAIVNVNAIDDDEGISEDIIESIRSLPGVKSAIPTSNYRITRGLGGRDISGIGGRGFGGGVMMPGGPGGRMFTSLSFTGIDPADIDSLVGEEIVATDGRRLDDSDSGETVVLLGYSIAINQNLNVGDEIEYAQEIEGSEETESYFFDVVGILEETGEDDIDGAAYVPLATMQSIEDEDTIRSLIVKAEDISNVEALTEDINNQFEDDVSARSFVTMLRQIESSLANMQIALLGIGAVAVLVGGIGITNTMIMSVMERRRDMGIMKAIGATRGTILNQVLQEAVIMSLIGGITGLIIAYIGLDIMPAITNFSGIITPELVIFGMGFAIVLGVGAGIYPALKASKLDPIEVLRYE
ncbi:MAG: ABC transporter permease [Candidatus Altiarchaeota archaeon]|nr:ABC transporter permease [Candidatus Altiarchaeota archaeon]